MKLAKPAGRPPRELAQLLVDVIDTDLPPHVTGVEVFGPGFVNFRLDDGWLHDIVPAVLAAGSDFGRSTLGAGRRVMVEFVSSKAILAAASWWPGRWLCCVRAWLSVLLST